jgi:hypothetical protein
VFIWYILSGFGFMYKEKSGNPALASSAEFQKRPSQREEEVGQRRK